MPVMCGQAHESNKNPVQASNFHKHHQKEKKEEDDDEEEEKKGGKEKGNKN